jgi:hypothetical protein
VSKPGGGGSKSIGQVGGGVLYAVCVGTSGKGDDKDEAFSW